MNGSDDSVLLLIADREAKRSGLGCYRLSPFFAFTKNSETLTVTNGEAPILIDRIFFTLAVTATNPAPFARIVVDGIQWDFEPLQPYPVVVDGQYPSSRVSALFVVRQQLTIQFINASSACFASASGYQINAAQQT